MIRCFARKVYARKLRNVKSGMVFHDAESMRVFRVVNVMYDLDAVEIAEVLFDSDGFVITSFSCGYLSSKQILKMCYICNYEELVFSEVKP